MCRILRIQWVTIGTNYLIIIQSHTYIWLSISTQIPVPRSGHKVFTAEIGYEYILNLSMILQKLNIAKYQLFHKKD